MNFSRILNLPPSIYCALVTLTLMIMLRYPEKERGFQGGKKTKHRQLGTQSGYCTILNSVFLLSSEETSLSLKAKGEMIYYP